MVFNHAMARWAASRATVYARFIDGFSPFLPDRNPAESRAWTQPAARTVFKRRKP